MSYLIQYQIGLPFLIAEGLSAAGCKSHILLAPPCLVAPVKSMLPAEAETHFLAMAFGFLYFHSIDLSLLLNHKMYATLRFRILRFQSASARK